jgi:hypothetical protein
VLPDLDSSGVLPPGIHECSWSEFAARFGNNAHRRALLAGLRRALIVLQAAGCSTIYIDGSFVTEKEFPADFDACWDRTGVNRATLQRLDPTLLDFSNRRAAQKAKYRGELFLADVSANSTGTKFLDFFQYDRDGKRKGIIKLDVRSFI